MIAIQSLLVVKTYINIGFNIERESRIAGWRLRIHIDKIRGTCQEKEDTFFKPKIDTGAFSRTKISDDESDFMVD